LKSSAGDQSKAIDFTFTGILDLRAIAIRANSTPKIYTPLSQTATDVISNQIVLYADQNNIHIYVGTNQSVNTQVYVIVEYYR
jgi:hypothetical protein